MDDSYSFGAWLRRRRKALDLTQDALARLVGVAAITIQKIEADERRPSRQVAELLADQLQVSTSEREGFLAAARGEQVVDQVMPPVLGTSVVSFSGAPRPPDLPSGTVTFLFSDIAGSTQRWEQQPNTMRHALARHDALLRAAIESHGGQVFKTVGDAFYAAFASAPDALAAALAAQRALMADDWGSITPLQVRMALHTGTAEPHSGDYLGQPLNRIARLLATGHGGQILLSLATHELVRDHLPDGVGLRDLGVHRLKDVVRPEPLFQVCAPDLPADFPPLISLDVRITNLPMQVNALIGRTREVAEVSALLGRARLVTLTGPGGTGKTRLALQTATELLDQHADGVWFIDLSPVSALDQVVTTVAQTLSIPEASDRPIRTGVLSWLRQRQTLLILDNCEQVIEAVADLVAELLRHAPSVTVLATSRIPLRITGEQEYAVAPLALPVPGTLPPLDQLSQYDAVALFIARARAVRTDFAITDTNASAVAEICIRLDGLPLAIELAAARVRLFPPEQLLSRLVSGRMQTLTGGARDLPARQQTIRATIDWSYRLLTASQQTLMARLGVFVGGWTQEAAEAVGGDAQIEVLPELDVLVEHSLVHVQAHAGATRYTMLETIREYTLERLLERGERELLHERHAGFFTEFAEAAEPGLYSAEAQRLLGILRPELDNLRAALAWSVVNAPDLAGRLSAALLEFWSTSIHLLEGVAWVEQALVRRSEMLPLVRAKLAVVAAFMLQWPQPIARVEALCQEAVAIYRELGDQRGLAHALVYYGSYFTRAAQNQLSEPLLAEGLQLAQACGPAWVVAWATFFKGWNCYHTLRIDEAQQYWRQTLDLYTEIGHVRGQASCLLAFGVAAFALGEYQRVWQLNEQRRQLDQSLGNRPGMAGCWRDMGLAALAQRRYAQAEQALREAVQYAIDDYVGEFRLWLSYALALGGHVVEARSEWHQARAQPFTDGLQTLNKALFTCAAAMMAASGHALLSARLCSFIEQHKPADPVPENLWETSPEHERWLEPVRERARAQLSLEPVMHFCS